MSRMQPGVLLGRLPQAELALEHGMLSRMQSPCSLLLSQRGNFINDTISGFHPCSPYSQALKSMSKSARVSQM